MLMQKYPMVDDLIPVARRRIPKFAFDYLDGGAGRETLLTRNETVFDDVQLTPRYLRDVSSVKLSKSLLGQDYDLPFGVAPVGLAGIIWPGAEKHMAQAARKAGIPFTLSTVATFSLEEIARYVGPRGWFQLYTPHDDHMKLDLIRRAREAEFEVLVVTVDVPGPARRERTLRSGLTLPPRITLYNVLNTAFCPAYVLSLLSEGMPQFQNLLPYLKDQTGMENVSTFIGKQLGRQLSNDDFSEIRDLWPGTLIVKGLLHPEDVENVVNLGADGVLISNHGGRQSDSSPTSLQMLPAIRRQIGRRAAILIDSGIRSGLDVVRALASGADFVMLGRAFYYGVAALGARGPNHVVDILREELEQSLRQIGCTDVEDLDQSWLTAPPAHRDKQNCRPELDSRS